MVAHRDFKQAVFEDGGPGGKPLFSDPADLAREIARNSEAFKGSERTVAANLSQILSGRRRCPPPLAEAILAAAHSRVGNGAEGWLEAFRGTVERLVERRGRVVDANTALARLRIAADEAADQFFVECDLAPPQASRGEGLLDVMASRLGLSGTGPGWKPESCPRYTLCVRGRDAANDFWRRIFMAALAGGLDETEASRRLEILNGEGRLRALVAPTEICGSAVLVFNPFGDGTSGFHQYYDPEGRIAVCEMDADHARVWASDILWHLEQGAIKGAPAPWSDVRETVARLARAAVLQS